MRQLAISAFLVIGGGDVFAQDWQHAPKPEQFPAGSRFSGKPAAAVLDTPKARRFRTAIREGASKGPNFAGHYTVVAWGCGLDSFELIVVDAESGRVSFPPFGCIALVGPFGDHFPDWGEFGNPAFRLDSRLLAVVGVEDVEGAKWEDRAAMFYVFENGRFTLLQKFPAPARRE